MEKRGPTIARKHYKPEEIVNLLRQAEVLHRQGLSMSDAIREREEENCNRIALEEEKHAGQRLSQDRGLSI